jgi:hypothetical protein
MNVVVTLHAVLFSLDAVAAAAATDHLFHSRFLLAHLFVDDALVHLSCFDVR